MWVHMHNNRRRGEEMIRSFRRIRLVKFVRTAEATDVFRFSEFVDWPTKQAKAPLQRQLQNNDRNQSQPTQTTNDKTALFFFASASFDMHCGCRQHFLFLPDSCLPDPFESSTSIILATLPSPPPQQHQQLQQHHQHHQQRCCALLPFS